MVLPTRSNIRLMCRSYMRVIPLRMNYINYFLGAGFLVGFFLAAGFALAALVSCECL